jgi:predicted nucleotidyltransferase component of viral defense system
MVKIPLILKLNRQLHKDTSSAQDIIVKALYKVFDKAVLHGGTAIWRCYSGNRFSEDIDCYIPKDIKKIDSLFDMLVKEGFVIKKKKIGDNSLYSNMQIGRTTVRFEALFKTAKGSLKEYETADGNFITIYTLTPEELIGEKVEAYIKRLKVRDLYDIFFLLRYVENKTKIKSALNKLIDNYKDPVDKEDLKVLVIEGIVPSPEKMVEYIGRV